MTIRKPFAVVPLPLSNITTGNARANRPATHLASQQLVGMRWQSNGNGNLWVRGQFDTIRAINFAALMGTNAQPGTTIRVRLGMSQAQVDGLAAYDSGVQPLISPSVSRADGVYHSHLEIPAVQNAFWWRIDIGGHNGDFAASALIFGEKREPAHFYNRDREIGFQDLGSLEISRNGVVAETSGSLLRTLLFRLQWVGDDEYQRIWSPMMEVKGKRQVMYWCLDPQANGNRQDMTFLGFMARDMFKRGNDFPKDNQMDFQFQALDFRTGPVLPLPISPAADEPSLLLDFSTLDTVFVRGPGDTQLRPRAFSPFVTFERTSTATRINAAGQIESVATGVPRLDHDPVTLQPLGLLIEGQRTNLLLNSSIDGTPLPSQSVTVTASVRTLSFYGTGTVTLSGAHSATLVGTGDYPERTTLTFTPNDGTLTLTVTGTVQFAQMEAGAFATSYIPTGASTARRTTDFAQITGSAFSDWFRPSASTFLVEGFFDPDRDSTTGNFYCDLSDGTLNNRIGMLDTNGTRGQIVSGGVVQFDDIVGPEPVAPIKIAFALQNNDGVICVNGVLGRPDGAMAIPAVNLLAIGMRSDFAAATAANGHIRSIRYWPQRLTNAQLQALTS